MDGCRFEVLRLMVSLEFDDDVALSLTKLVPKKKEDTRTATLNFALGPAFQKALLLLQYNNERYLIAPPICLGIASSASMSAETAGKHPSSHAALHSTPQLTMNDT